jgi:hypothetical protein
MKEWIKFGRCKTIKKIFEVANWLKIHDEHELRALTPSAQSDRIEKRMKRIERMKTDFDSPSARPYPPQAE